PLPPVPRARRSQRQMAERLLRRTGGPDGRSRRGPMGAGHGAGRTGLAERESADAGGRPVMKGSLMKTMGLIVILLAGCALPAQPMAPGGDELFRDDFSKFPIGMLSQPVAQLNPAVQEYHWLARRGVPLDPWENPIIYLDPWSAG